MIETSIVPAKINLDIPGKILAIVLALAISIFQSTNAAAANTLILDNDEAGTSSTGKWWTSNGSNPYGKNSLKAFRRGAAYTYTVTLPTTGEYQVFARWAQSSKHRTSVPYDITHLGGTSTVTVNQKKSSGQWNQLGNTWHFDKTATITIRSLGNGSTNADAIMFVPTETPVENTAPVISGTPAGSVTANAGYSFQPSASDADGDQLTFSISNKPAWASFSTSSGRLNGTPADSHVKTYSGIVISVSDGTDAVSLPGFSIQVDAAPIENTAPVINGTPAGSVTANAGYSFQPSASDADGDQLAFSISGKPAWASFSTSSGRLNGTPADSHVKTYSGIVISVSDGTDAVSLPGFSIQVDAAQIENTAPVISGTPAGLVTANEGYSFQPSASDADGDQLTFSISNKPVWASFNTDSGRLSGTPADSHVKTYSGIVISVSDGTDAVSLPGFSIQVDAEEGSPRVTANLVSFYPFTERSGNVVRDLSGSASPMNLTISGNVSWYGSGNGVVMNGGRVGTQGPATDLINALRVSNTSTFEIWIQPANITQFGPARMISVGGDIYNQNFMLGQDSDDIEARLLHTGKQSMLDPRLVTGNGVLDASLVHLVHTYDGAVERLYINGVQHSETVARSGGYGNWDMSHLFSIGNEASSDRPYNGIIHLVAVYDRSLGTAEIQQNYGAGPVVTGVDGGTGGGNHVPVISGTPAGSVATDVSYDFMPTASDADGDTLVFSITGKPAWANFDISTGRLSGTPILSEAGTYSNIVISVTDGTDTASLGTFSITVNSTETQTGSVTLNWTAPVARTDGSPLTMSEIAGFTVHYGTSTGSHPNVLSVDDGSATSATIADLQAGTYYLVVTTRDYEGRESGDSGEVAKVAN